MAGDDGSDVSRRTLGLTVLCARWLRWTAYCIAAGVVAVAVSLASLRWWLLPNIQQFRDELALSIASRLGQPVTFDALAAHFEGWSLVVELRNCQVLSRDQARSALHFDQIRTRLGMMGLLGGRLVVDELGLRGLSVTLVRRSDGRVVLQDFEGSDGSPTWLLAEGRIVVESAHVTWRDERVGGAVLQASADAVWVNAGDSHQLSAMLRFGDEQKLQLVANFSGFEPTWAGRAFLEATRLDAGQLARFVRLEHVALQQGTISGRLWTQFQDGALSRATGLADLQRVWLVRNGPAEEGVSQLRVDGLSARFRWIRNAAGWGLGVREMILRSGDGRSAPLAWELGYRSDADKALWSFASERIPLDDFSGMQHFLLAYLDAAPPDWRLTGTLADVKAWAAVGASTPPELAVCGRFDALGWSPAANLPGVKGMSGRLCGTDAQGALTLDGTASRLEWPRVFGGALPLGQLTGAIHWARDGEVFDIRLRDLKIESPSLALSLAGSVGLPVAAPSDVQVDLQFELPRLQLRSLPTLLPVHVMTEPAQRWFGSAFPDEGWVRGVAVLRGRPNAFPFRSGDGVFRARLQVDDATVRFNPEWLPLRHVQGELEMVDAAAHMEVAGADLGAAAIKPSRIELPDVLEKPRLLVDAHLVFGLPVLTEVLAQSPLETIAQRLRRYTVMSGVGDLDLKLDVPLEKSLGKTAVDGTLHMTDSTMRVPVAHLAMEHMHGDLHFTRSTLDANGIDGELAGGSARLNINTRDNRINLNWRGKMTTQALAQAWPWRYWRYAVGEAPYALEVSFSDRLNGGEEPLRVSLQSALAGIAVSLPPPYAKPAAAALASRAELQAYPDGRMPIRLWYGDNAEARLNYRNTAERTEFLGGELALGGTTAGAGRRDGWSVIGRVPELDIDAWQPVVAPNQLDEAIAAESEALRRCRLATDRLLWNGRDLGRIDFAAERDGTAWRGQFEGQFAKGSFRVPVGERASSPMDVQLDWLRVPSDASRQGLPPPAEPLNPGRLPSLKLRANRLVWHAAELGRLELDTERQIEGLKITAAKLADANHSLALKGSWRRAGDSEMTRLVGQFETKDLGASLAKLGYAEHVRETPGKMAFALNWSAAPLNVDLHSLNGELQADFGKGGLPHVDPGLGRVLGILNIDSLRRRLSFDFSDVFSKGLAYDRIKGQWKVRSGNAHSDAFLIDAVAARIFLSGRVGFASKDVDEIVTVVPRATATLPIAGMLAGGPAVGAAIYVAQKVIGEEIDSVTASQYSVRGRWSNPTVKPVSRPIPLEFIDRAWTGLKDISGFGDEEAHDE